MGTELDTIRWHLVEARGGGDARHEIDGAFAALAGRLSSIERDILALKPAGRSDEMSDYEVLRDAIVELLDPENDGVAEVAILIQAVKDVVAERDELRKACQSVLSDLDDKIRWTSVSRRFAAQRLRAALRKDS